MKSINFFKLGFSHDARGELFVTSFSQLPFIPIRMFFISTNQSLYERGGHGHKICWQALIPTLGSVNIFLSKESKNAEFVVSKGSGLIIPPGNWVRIQFENPNEKLIILASHEYEASDYFY